MDNKEYITREVEERASLETEARALLDRAAEEKRDLTPEEDEQFDKIIAASDRHKERIGKLERMDAANVMTEETRQIVAAATTITETSQQTWNQAFSEGIRSFFGPGEHPSLTLPDLVLPDSYEARALEAVSLVNMPLDFRSQIVLYQRTATPWLRLATIINGTDIAPLYLPRITTDPTTYSPGQGTAITASDPVNTSVAATPVGYKALTYISQEMSQSDVTGIAGFIAQTQGRSIGLYFGSVTTAAVLAAATNGGTAAGTPFFDMDDLLTLIYGRAAPYRANAQFVMSNGAIVKARKFKDSNGQYLWQPSQQVGQPDLLQGYPVYEDPYLATPASATKSVLFGDMSAWFIKQLPLRTAISTEVKFAEDQVGFKSVYWAGGALPDAIAIAYLVSYNT